MNACGMITRARRGCREQPLGASVESTASQVPVQSNEQNEAISEPTIEGGNTDNRDNYEEDDLVTKAL